MAKKDHESKGKDKKDQSGRKRHPNSTTSLGKRRSRSKSPAQRQTSITSRQSTASKQPSVGTAGSTMSNPRSSEYGSQASPLRMPAQPKDLIKVTVVGAAGGIGQPLSLLLMMHSEYIHHLALYDLVDSTPGVGLDVSHIDRQVKVTVHVGLESLAEAVQGASVIVVLAGLAQKPGMSRDDLFGTNAKIMYNIAKCCAQTAPEAMLCIVTNPVNSLVPLACEVYSRYGNCKGQQADKQQQQKQNDQAAQATQQQQQQQSQAAKPEQSGGQQEASAPAAKPAGGKSNKSVSQIGGAKFEDCFRRIFGVTTLDVIRASTLTAKSAFFKQEANSLFKDPGKVQVPVVGGHAGKTIMPLLSQASPKLDRKRLQEEKATVDTLIESVQQAGPDVLNAKKGRGSATLSMAYAACRFTVSLLRAMAGEHNIVECAYVRHANPCYGDLEYFAVPLVLGKDGYTKTVCNYMPCPTGNAACSSLLSSGGSAASSTGGTTQAAAPASPSAGSKTAQSGSATEGNKLLPFELQMLEEGSRELRLSIAKGEDFAKEQLSADK